VSVPDPARDLEHLADLAVDEFGARLAASGWTDLRPARLEIFQINVGRLCNQTCRYCHVDAGPDRVRENMDRGTMEQALALLDRLDAPTVDITGGAPELHPDFRWLVEECVRRKKHVIDRCNLTVLLLPKHADLPAWLGERGVEIVASLPHHRMRNTDAQRGDGVFERSIEALRLLNAAGYGRGDPRRVLTLMHNPAGAYLPAGQKSLEAEWRASLARQFGITFDRLIALNNMPIGRYLDWLVESGNFESYMERLAAAFNPAAVAGLMCRNTISIGWDGRIFDCDFNQMLELDSVPAEGRAHVADFVEAGFASRRIVTRRHCFGCTAGAGSSCGGATT
jgi:radical SAM/Cys-rich protein